MTRNIVASFSSKLDANNNLKEYEVVSGSTFTDQFNETLDSASILLAHISAEDRLIDIKPYDFCRVYDKASETSPGSGVYSFDHTYLVDNYSEKEDRIYDSNQQQRIFSYTISLMSETKLLEKVQCPNVAITHKIVNGNVVKKTIYEHICEYMELFGPKVKKHYVVNNVDKWKYDYLIKIPGTKQEQNYYSGEISVFETFNRTISPGQQVSVTKVIPSLIGKTVSIDEARISNVPGGGIGALEIIQESFIQATGTFRFTVRNTSTQAGSTVNAFRIDFDYNAILGKTYHYEPDQNDTEQMAFYNKFNVPCADLAENYPTLRQLLSRIMIQVSCIPTVNNLKLGFLDYTDGGQTFVVDNTINYIQKSLSSDSFANTLINASNDVLDSGNKVVSEILGFRDRSNVSLKQQQNLFLETKFPIYNIESFKINCMLNNSISTALEKDLHYSVTSILASNRVSFELETTHATNTNTISYTLYAEDKSGVQMVLYNASLEVKLKTYTYNSTNNKFILLEEKTENKNFNGTATGGEQIHQDYSASMVNNFSYYILEIKISGKITQATEGYSAEFNFIPDWLTDFKLDAISFSGPMMVSVPITPLVLDSQKRSLLETNYLKMNEVSTIEELAKFKYGTVGYNIGGKQIYGFSDYYSEVKVAGLFSYNYGRTYIEAMYEWLKNHYFAPQIREILKNSFGIGFNNDSVISVSLFKENDTDFIKFTQFTFDIEYQPLNTFNLAFTKSKEDILFPIEQYNSGASGVADFDRLSINNQETVDRIGNDVLSISQRLGSDQFSSLRGGLPFKPTILTRDGMEYTVFRRTFTVGNYKYDVNYTASKDAILKNYFTSIRTKYRAYQYVGVNDSTLRKERDTLFIRLGEDYYNGDNKLSWFANSYFRDKAFLTGFEDFSSSKNLKYVIENSANAKMENEFIKNDISLITNDNSMAIIYEQFDNVSAGSYIANVDYTTYYDFSKTAYDEDGKEITGTASEKKEKRIKIGGVPQEWQEWNENIYNNNHIIFYTNFLNYYEKANDVILYPTTEQAIESISTAAKSPILDSNVYLERTSTTNRFYIADDNTSEYRSRTFYKDLSERLNHTVQFIYYAASPNIAWTENFIANSVLIQNADFSPNSIYATDNMSLNKLLHTATSGDEFLNNEISEYVTLHSGTSGENDYLQVEWNGHSIIKVCYKEAVTGKIADFIVFKRPNETDTTTKFYITVNDTKTDYVVEEGHGMIYKKYIVEKDTLGRTVEELD